MIFSFAICFMVSCFFIQKTEAFGIVYPDFDSSMLRQTLDSSEKVMKRKKLYSDLSSKYVNLFREIYERNIVEASESTSIDINRIPRIIHQICLGTTVPLKFQESIESWMRLNNWEYKLWTDEKVKEMRMFNRDLYDKETNAEEKSNILRLEILAQHGGLYVDMDYECLNSEIFEELHRNFDFYIGFNPVEHGKIGKFNVFKASNAIIGAVPNHPLVQDLLINLQSSYLAYKGYTPVEKTGSAYCTRIICQYAAVENELKGTPVFRNIYLPTTFFYFLTDADDVENNPLCMESNFLPETASIHYFKGSLMKKKQREREI